MTRVRGSLAPKEEAERLAARRALKSLIRFKLDVAKEHYGQRESVKIALIAVEAIAEFLAVTKGSADALELVEQYVISLRQRAQSRHEPQGKGAVK